MSYNKYTVPELAGAISSNKTYLAEERFELSSLSPSPGKTVLENKIKQRIQTIRDLEEEFEKRFDNNKGGARKSKRRGKKGKRTRKYRKSKSKSKSKSKK